MSTSGIPASMFAFTMLASKRAVEYLSDVQMQTARLAIVVGAESFDSVMAEVDRREELFARVRDETLNGTEHPRLAALDSVFQDALKGRL